MSETTIRRKRTNEEILAANIAERKAKEAARKERDALRAARKKTSGAGKTTRVRRTRAQIEADKVAEAAAREKLAQERADKIPAPKVPKFRKTVTFVNGGKTAFGKVWEAGESVTIEEGTSEYDQSFDNDGNFIFGQSEDEQIKRYGVVRYTVSD